MSEDVDIAEKKSYASGLPLCDTCPMWKINNSESQTKGLASQMILNSAKLLQNKKIKEIKCQQYTCKTPFGKTDAAMNKEPEAADLCVVSTLPCCLRHFWKSMSRLVHSSQMNWYQ